MYFLPGSLLLHYISWYKLRIQKGNHIFNEYTVNTSLCMGWVCTLKDSCYVIWNLRVVILGDEPGGWPISHKELGQCLWESWISFCDFGVCPNLWLCVLFCDLFFTRISAIVPFVSMSSPSQCVNDLNCTTSKTVSWIKNIALLFIIVLKANWYNSWHD